MTSLSFSMSNDKGKLFFWLKVLHFHPKLGFRVWDASRNACRDCGLPYGSTGRHWYNIFSVHRLHPISPFGFTNCNHPRLCTIQGVYNIVCRLTMHSHRMRICRLSLLVWVVKLYSREWFAQVCEFTRTSGGGGASSCGCQGFFPAINSQPWPR